MAKTDIKLTTAKQTKGLNSKEFEIKTPFVITFIKK